MKVDEVIGTDKLIQVMFKAMKKKKNNPKKSKTTASNSFIDVFGGLAGYDNPSGGGEGGMTHQA